MRHHRQRGAVTLAITLIMLFVLGLAALQSQRRHVDEQRASAREARADQAFEAAEAGLEWGLAMLNAPQPVDGQCRAAAGAATSFRERHLAIAPASGTITPLARRAACARVGESWHCRCPVDEAPPAPDDDGTAVAAFELRFDAAVAPGLVRLVATGCRRLPCAEGDDASEGPRRLEVTLGLMPALAHPPIAALTVRGDVDAGDAALGLHNGDATAGGIAVQAGGVVRATHARTSGAPGAPTPTVVERDSALRAIEPARLFASLFGLDAVLWRRQPGVATLACPGFCTERLADTLATHRLVFVDGDLSLDGTVALGTRERPVIIVAAGAVRLHGAVSIHGLVYGASIAWDGGTRGAGVRGALVAEKGYAGRAAADLVYDRAVLDALKTAGSFVRLPGSWKDFR